MQLWARLSTAYLLYEGYRRLELSLCQGPGDAEGFAEADKPETFEEVLASSFFAQQWPSGVFPVNFLLVLVLVLIPVAFIVLRLMSGWRSTSSGGLHDCSEDTPARHVEDSIKGVCSLAEGGLLTEDSGEPSPSSVGTSSGKGGAPPPVPPSRRVGKGSGPGAPSPMNGKGASRGGKGSALLTAAPPVFGRKFHWRTLDAVDGTIFEEIGDDSGGGGSQLHTHGVQMLQAIFLPSGAPGTPGGSTGSSGGRPAFVRRTSGVSVLDSKRAQQLGIMFKKSKLGVEFLYRTLMELDFRVPFGEEDIAQWIDVWPTAEEGKKIEEQKGEQDLRDIEQNALRLASVPRGQARLRALRLYKGLDLLQATCTPGLKVVKGACEQLLLSSKWRTVLREALRIGNFINHGPDAQVRTRGFLLDALLQLKTMKGSGGATALHCLCVTCAQEDPCFCEALHHELRDISTTARDNAIDSTRELIVRLREDLEMMRSELCNHRGAYSAPEDEQSDACNVSSEDFDSCDPPEKWRIDRSEVQLSSRERLLLDQRHELRGDQCLPNASIVFYRMPSLQIHSLSRTPRSLLTAMVEETTVDQGSDSDEVSCIGPLDPLTPTSGEPSLSVPSVREIESMAEVDDVGPLERQTLIALAKAMSPERSPFGLTDTLTWYASPSASGVEETVSELASCERGLSHRTTMPTLSMERDITRGSSSCYFSARGSCLSLPARTLDSGVHRLGAVLQEAGLTPRGPPNPANTPHLTSTPRRRQRSSSVPLTPGGSPVPDGSLERHQNRSLGLAQWYSGLPAETPRVIRADTYCPGPQVYGQSIHRERRVDYSPWHGTAPMTPGSPGASKSNPDVELEATAAGAAAASGVFAIFPGNSTQVLPVDVLNGTTPLRLEMENASCGALVRGLLNGLNGTVRLPHSSLIANATEGDRRCKGSRGATGVAGSSALKRLEHLVSTGSVLLLSADEEMKDASDIFKRCERYFGVSSSGDSAPAGQLLPGVTEFLTAFRCAWEDVLRDERWGHLLPGELVVRRPSRAGMGGRSSGRRRLSEII